MSGEVNMIPTTRKNGEGEGGGRRSKFWGGPTLEILSKEAWLKKSPCNSYPIYVAISYIKCNTVYLWRDSTDSNSLSILSNPTTD